MDRGLATWSLPDTSSLAEECAQAVLINCDFFVHFSLQFIMSRGVGMKWHRTMIFDWSVHIAFLRSKCFLNPPLLPAERKRSHFESRGEKRRVNSPSQS